MEATASGSKRILECAGEAKSPHRILVRSLLRSRNTLRAKYRELRAECKRWRNQAAAVEKSRSAWRRRALTAETALQHEPAERAVLEARVQGLREQTAAPGTESAASRARPADPEGGEKRGR
jgi:chromosome segregation ATPase